MAWLLHSDFFCSTPWGVVYVLYIINEFLLPFYKKIIPRIIAVANAFYVVYVLYIITNVFGKISLKIIPRIIAVTTLFSGICPLYYQYCNWENPYKKDTAVYPVCQLLFFEIYVLILSIGFWGNYSI